MGGELLQLLQERAGDRLPLELPEHGAQLGLLVEGQPVVDAPDVAVAAAQDMPGLAVGVVGEEVEQRHPLDDPRIELLVAQHVPVLVGLDEELKAAHPVRSVAHHGQRDQVPAERPGGAVGGHLAEIERPAGEVVQGDLAAARLVDADVARAIRQAERGGEGVIGGPGDQLEEAECSLAEEPFGLVEAARLRRLVARSWRHARIPAARGRPRE